MPNLIDPAASAASNTEGPSSPTVPSALRLGWTFAEVHGRYRWIRQPRPMADTVVAGRGAWLPLSSELSPVERAVETEKSLKRMAASWNLDFRDIEVPKGVDPPATVALTTLAKRLTAPDVEVADRETAEKELTRLLIVWDRKIQDSLSGQSAEVSAAYQLGRGLGEVYWTVDAASPGASLGVVLGRRRVDALHELLIPLSAQLPPLTIRAINHSLDKWCLYSLTARHAQSDVVVAALVAQHRVWERLLIFGVDPASLISAHKAVARARALGPVVEAYRLEFAALALGLALAGLGALAAVLGADRWTPVVAGAAGVAGISISATLARAKNAVHGVSAWLRTQLDVELVEEAATTIPPDT